jgi:His/Glu/Gln/Arg/opine family amino acid ABC transporter permease subunit
MTGGSVSSAAAEQVSAPPDVRGPTAPLPAGVLAAGAAALAAVLAGTLIVQIVFAVAGGELTPLCRENLARGVEEELVEGAVGVCHIVEGLNSPVESALLSVGLALGLGALVVGVVQFRRMPTKRMREQCIAGAAMGTQAAQVVVALLWFRSSDTVFTFARNFMNFAVLEGTFGAFLRGAKNTMSLAVIGEMGGIIIGLILAMLVLSVRRTVRAPARLYINFFRGTPLIWQLPFFYFLFRIGFGLDVSGFTTALVVFSLNTGAYAAEVFRAGIQSIERGQMEAARSLGMSYTQAMRYAIVPQAVRRVIPPLMNEFVILIKDTALIISLGLTVAEYDLLTTARDGYSRTLNGTFFVAAAFGYLVVTLPLIRIVTWVENRYHSGLTGVVGHT